MSARPERGASGASTRAAYEAGKDAGEAVSCALRAGMADLADGHARLVFCIAALCIIAEMMAAQFGPRLAVAAFEVLFRAMRGGGPRAGAGATPAGAAVH